MMLQSTIGGPCRLSKKPMRLPARVGNPDAGLHPGRIFHKTGEDAFVTLLYLTLIDTMLLTVLMMHFRT